jgi:glycosyltransferase involved in cell wall biosynthesis
MSRGRLHIAVIGTRGLPGTYSGIERVAEHLYPRLVERGHRVTLYCRAKRGGPAAAYYRGIRRVELPAIHWRSAETISHAMLSMAHALLSERVDLIQLEALAPALLSRAGSMHAVPIVVRVHGLDWQRAKWGRMAARVLRAGEVAAVRHAEEIIVVSRDLQQYFAQTHGRAVLHIPNGAPVDDAEASAETAELEPFGLTAGRYFLCLGRLVPEKRIEDAIAAFARIGAPYRLAIVGAGSYTDGYVARLHDLAARDPRIVFTGFQSGATLRALQAHAAALISASELEGLPMSVLECLDRGVPAILSDIAPHRELVERVPEYDLFHPVADVEALAARLRAVAAQPAEHRLIAESARAAVRNAFSWSAIADRTEEALFAVVERYRCRATAARRQVPSTVEAELA